MPNFWNIEWLDSNAQRAYPLSEDATRTDVTGAFQLPDDFLVSLYLSVGSALEVDPTKFYLQSISAFATGYNIGIGYDDGTAAPPVVATAVIPSATHAEDDSYVLAGTGDFVDAIGRVTIGLLTSVGIQPAGRYLFDLAGGRLEPECIRPMIRDVTSITVVNGTERSPRLYGDIELVSGDNMQISVVAIGAVNQVRFDAISGAGLIENCACEADVGPPIRTINHVPPGPDGNFTLLGNACLELGPIANGLKLSDVCADPCCGCPELERLTRELDQFGAAAATLRNFVDRLRTQVDTMESNLLGSRLNVGGCSTA
jgi:hypothetical protein